MNIKSISGSSILLFFRDLIRQFFNNQGLLNASALTYTTLFAVVPLVTVSYSMLAAIPTFQGAGDVIQEWVFDNFVPATGEVVHQYLSDFTSQARRLTAVGVVFLVITSIMMMKNIEAALNRIWRVTEPRKGVSSFLLYWAVLSLGPFLVGLGLLVTSYVTALPAFSTASDAVGQGRLLTLVPVVFSAVAFMLLYSAVPNCQVPLKNAFIGGVAAALSFEAAKRGFAFFVTQFPSYELIYGAFAAVPMFLAWVYVCWVIILMGAELSRALTIYQITKRNRHEPHLYTVLGVLNRLWYAQQQGRALSDTELLQQTPGLDQGRWDGYVQLLLEADVIRRTDAGSYLLARDLNRFSLEQLRALMPWPIPDAVDNPEARPWELQLSARLAELSRTRTELLEIDLATLFSIQDTKS